MEIQHIVEAILNGDADSNFGAIIQAVKDRKDMRGSIAKAAMKPGDKIRLQNCRPKYLNGLPGVIVRLNPKKVVVDLDEPNGKWHKAIHCPVNMIELVS